MILYHFPTSPFARRARLALAHKGLFPELRDARANPEHRAEMQRLNPFHTVPVLVDGERVIADSTAICHYLQRTLPDPPLWPAGLPGAEVFEFMALADGVIATLANTGMRFYSLHGDPAFPGVRAEMVGRVQRALDTLAARAGARGQGVPLCGESWSVADMALYTLVAWLEGLPARAAQFAPAQQVVSLGWSLPPALSAWAEPHRQREDVRGLG